MNPRVRLASHFRSLMILVLLLVGMVVIISGSLGAFSPFINTMW